MAQRSAAKRHAPGTRRSRGRGAAIAAAALLLALSAFSALGHGESLEGDDPSARAASATGHSAGGPVQPVAVLFDLRRRGRPVKPGFLGLSFEVASLPQIARYDGGGNFIKLLRSLGPGVLRFGGASADTRIAWSDASTPTPAWASGVLTESDLRALAKVASSSGWRVLLTLGLAHYEPLAAAHEAGAARAALGSTLAGIELGNEPDAYANHALREEPWTFAQYDGQAHGYLGAIRAQAPGIPLAGPDVSGSAAFIDWGSGEARLRPQLLTGHHYPLGCHEVPGPSIERLLSAETRQAEDVSLARYMRVARADGIAFRLDETNSVSCGGRAGVSDTFASALWAVSYIARAMAAGVSGINFHDDPANCRGYAPLCALTAARLGSGALSARPEWYALLLTKGLIGDRPVQTRLATVIAGQTPNLSVTSLRAPDGRLHVVVVDEDPPGSPPVMLHLHAPNGYTTARVLSLTAPSPLASTGVRLGGRGVQADGAWSEPRSLPRARRHRKLIQVSVAPSSALLLTLS